MAGWGKNRKRAVRTYYQLGLVYVEQFNLFIRDFRVKTRSNPPNTPYHIYKLHLSREELGMLVHLVSSWGVEFDDTKEDPYPRMGEALPVLIEKAFLAKFPNYPAKKAADDLALPPEGKGDDYDWETDTNPLVVAIREKYASFKKYPCYLQREKTEQTKKRMQDERRQAKRKLKARRPMGY